MSVSQAGKDEVNKMEKEVNVHTSATNETKENCCKCNLKHFVDYKITKIVRAL